MLVLVHAVIYLEYWTGAKLFTGKDTFTQYMPLINFQSDCLQEGSWPLWIPFMNFGFPYVELNQNSSLFPTHLLLGLVTGSSMAIYQREVLLWILLGGAGIFFCVRELGYSRTAGLIAGVGFMFSGQLMVLTSWSIIIYNACCFPYLILGYQRAKRTGDPLSLLSIIFLALPFFAGYISSYVHGLYYFGGYVVIDSLLSRKPRFGAIYLFLTGAAAGLLVLPKALPVMISMGDYGRMGVVETRANPLEIISVYNLMSFALPVKYYFSVYIGEFVIIAFIYGLMRKRFKADALLAMFLLSAWMLLVDKEGNFSLLHRAANAVLPLMKLTRNEWMYWNYPLTFAILYLSRYLDPFLQRGDMKYKAAAAGVFIGLLSLLFVTAYDVRVHYQAYMVHLCLALLWLAAPISASKRTLQAGLVLLLLTTEFYFLFHRVNVDEPPLREGAYMDILLTHQLYSSESFMDGELVRQRMPLRVLDDQGRPSISDSRALPVLSSGLDGDFVNSMNQKRFAGWWYNTQERSDFVSLKESPLLAAMEGQPLFALFDRASRQPVDNTVSFDGISCSSFSFGVNSPGQGFFLLHQMFDPRWRAYVDGSEQPVQRANTYFMGLEISQGRHAVVFRFRDKVFSASLGVSLVTLCGLIGASIMRARRLRRGLRETASP